MTTERGIPLTHGTRTRARRSTRPVGAARSRPKRSFGPDRLTVVLFTVAAFLVVLALLAGQLQAAPARSAARPVTELRRIYQTTVVETLVGASRRGAAGGGSSVTQSVSSSGSAAAPASAPTTRTS